MGLRRVAIDLPSFEAGRDEHPAGTDGIRRFAILLDGLDSWLVQWMGRIAPLAVRLGLGIVFSWFGVLKFVPGLSPAEGLAIRTMDILTCGLVHPSVAIVVLAAWETIIGLGLLLNVAMRLTLSLLFLQMMGTLTPLFLFPHELFTERYCAPTLEGQYIIKNVVLIGAALVLGGMLRGGAIVRVRGRGTARRA
jgi:uncharacterized membrane protein YkgB